MGNREIVESIVDELESLGVKEYDSPIPEGMVEREPCSLDDILQIIKDAPGHNEVSKAAKMIGEKSIITSQILFITSHFKYESIHFSKFILEIIRNISDPENIEEMIINSSLCNCKRWPILCSKNGHTSDCKGIKFIDMIKMLMPNGSYNPYVPAPISIPKAKSKYSLMNPKINYPKALLISTIVHFVTIAMLILSLLF